MNIIIKRNGQLADRFIIDEEVTASEFEVVCVPNEDMPKRPTTDAGIGKYWRLDYVDGVLGWYAADRELTTEERMTQMEQELKAAKILMGVE